MKKTSDKKELPRIFVGSSVEGLKIANAIQLLLEHDAEVTVWTQGIFEPSSNSLDDLIEGLSRFDFGIFIFSPDDITKIRQKRYLVARDNVIFEMGLFVGRLGKKRTLYVIPRGITNFHLPSDLIGVSPLDYESDRSDGNVQAALGAACTKIRERINKLGRFESPVIVKEINSTLEESIFSKQEDAEFKRIYEKLKPSRKASVTVAKRNPENQYNSTKLGECILHYSPLRIIWTNINDGNNTFNYFLSRHQEKAEEIVISKLSSIDSDKLVCYEIESQENLIPILSTLGLLDEQLDNDPSQMVPNFAFHIHSKKMYRFFDWIDYKNLHTNEPLLEFVEFIEVKK